jgi:hypothetical protein
LKKRGKAKEITMSANKFEYEKESEKIFELANKLMSSNRKQGKRGKRKRAKDSLVS